MVKENILRVIIKDGKFKSGTDYPSEKKFKVSPTKFSKAGWNCEILEDKSIKCICTDGKNSFEYVIDSEGKAKSTIKVYGEKTRVINHGNVFSKSGPATNGTLRLSKNIEIRYRYIFFIEAKD